MSTENNLPDPQEIIDTLNNIRKEYWLNRTERNLSELCDKPLEGEALTKFLKCATDLSSLLPKVSNSSLFEVDHLLYSDEKNYIDVSGTKMCSEETMTYLIENCFDSFYNLYVYAACLYGRVVDMTYLQLIEHSSTNLFRKINNDYYIKIVRVVYLLTCYRNIKPLSLGQGLRILSIVSDKHLELVTEQIFCEINTMMTLFLRLRNLTFIPESESSHTNDMTSWLSRLAKEVLSKLDLTKMKFPNIEPDLEHENWRTIMVEYIRKYYPLKTEHLNPEFICHLLKMIEVVYWPEMPFYYENLAVYFLTAKNDEEKITRIKNFFEGLKLYDSKPDKNSNTPPMRKIFYQFLDNIAFIFNATRLCQGSLLKLLEEHYASIIDQPYLTIGSKCSSYLQFRDKTSQLMNQYFTISDDTPVSEPLFTLSKIFYFSDFVRMLKVMDAMHTAYLIYDEIFETKKVDSTFITNEFRPFPSEFKKFLSDFLRNPSMRGQSLWWFQYLLKKCPFLFLSYDHESHMENLIKMLKGIKISKADEEALYFAVNNKSHSITNGDIYPMYIDNHAVLEGTNDYDEQDSDSDDSDADE